MSYQTPNKPMPGGYQQPIQKMGAKTSAMAILSLVLGVLSVCFGLLSGLPAILFGFIALIGINKSQGAVGGKGLAIGGMVTGVGGTLLSVALLVLMVAGLLPAVNAARNAAEQMEDSNDMKQIGLAMLTFHETYKRLPCSGAEENLENEELLKYSQLSWRVQILPFLGYQQLYDRFDPDQPWDSPTNLALLSEMPDVYKSSLTDLPDGFTSYMALVPGDNVPEDKYTMIRPSVHNRFASVFDGLSNTVLAIDAGANNACEWTRPQDFEVDWNAPSKGLEIDPFGGMSVIFGDGSSQRIEREVNDEKLRALFFANDGEVVGF